MKCLSCGKNKAVLNSPFGYLPCKKCQTKQKKFKAPETIEITTSAIKEDRKKFDGDILQRYRGDTANKRYIKKYGTKGFTPEQVKNAKDVYPNYYKEE